MAEIVNTYNKVAPEISKVYDQQNHNTGIDAFIKHLKPHRRILDVGSGMGKDVRTFSKLGFKAVGVEGSKGMITEAKKRYPGEKFQLADIRKLEFPKESFDAVWSWSVLTHLKNEDKIIVLKKIYYLLHERGIFSQTIWRGRGLFINKHIYPRSHFLIGVPSWNKLYKEAGFSKPQIKYIKGKGRNFIRITAKKTSSAS